MNDAVRFSQTIQTYITQKNETCDKFYEIIDERINDSFTLKQYSLNKLKSGQELFEENLLSFERSIHEINEKYNASVKKPMMIMMKLQCIISLVNEILNNFKCIDSIIKEVEEKDYVIDYNECSNLVYHISRNNEYIKIDITRLQFLLE